jgi:hypothetical protein
MSSAQPFANLISRFLTAFSLSSSNAPDILFKEAVIFCALQKECFTGQIELISIE